MSTRLICRIATIALAFTSAVLHAPFLAKVIKLKAVAAILAIALAVGFAGASTYQKAFGQKPPEPLIPVANPAPPAPAPAAPRLRNPLESPYTGGDAFGPAKTMTISGQDDPSGRYYGDLDTGSVYDPPTQRRVLGPPNGLPWLSTHGFDLSYQNTPSIRTLFAYDMAVLQVRDGFLNEVTPTQLLSALLQTGPAVHAGMSANIVPATFCFRTREGGVGILELAKINANPSTIEVRCKLLDPKVRDTLVSQVAASRLLPDLEKQLQIVVTAEAQNDKARLSHGMKILASQATALAEFTRGTPWAARTRLVASTAQLAADLIEQPTPGLKAGTQEIRQTLAPLTIDINKAAAASQPADKPVTGNLP